MIHGDLKGVRCKNLRPISYLTVLTKANILIDRTGSARLADFGLLVVLSDPANSVPSSSYTGGGTVRWMGPELIAPQEFGLKTSQPTKSSDCYSLGMVIYETISGNLPFHEDTDIMVFLKVVRGERPHHDTRFTERLWEKLEHCWMHRPDDRPSIEDVLQCLERCDLPDTGTLLAGESICRTDSENGDDNKRKPVDKESAPIRMLAGSGAGLPQVPPEGTRGSSTHEHGYLGIDFQPHQVCVRYYLSDLSSQFHFSLQVSTTTEIQFHQIIVAMVEAKKGEVISPIQAPSQILDPASGTALFNLDIAVINPHPIKQHLASFRLHKFVARQTTRIPNALYRKIREKAW